MQRVIDFVGKPYDAPCEGIPKKAMFYCYRYAGLGAVRKSTSGPDGELTSCVEHGLRGDALIGCATGITGFDWTNLSACDALPSNARDDCTYWAVAHMPGSSIDTSTIGKRCAALHESAVACASGVGSLIRLHGLADSEKEVSCKSAPAGRLRQACFDGQYDCVFRMPYSDALPAICRGSGKLRSDR
jgi:hypothetical protein